MQLLEMRRGWEKHSHEEREWRHCLGSEWPQQLLPSACQGLKHPAPSSTLDFALPIYTFRFLYVFFFLLSLN